MHRQGVRLHKGRRAWSGSCGSPDTHADAGQRTMEPQARGRRDAISGPQFGGPFSANVPEERQRERRIRWTSAYPDTRPRCNVKARKQRGKALMKPGVDCTVRHNYGASCRCVLPKGGNGRDEKIDPSRLLEADFPLFRLSLSPSLFLTMASSVYFCFFLTKGQNRKEQRGQHILKERAQWCWPTIPLNKGRRYAVCNSSLHGRMK